MRIATVQTGTVLSQGPVVGTCGDLTVVNTGSNTTPRLVSGREVK